MASSKLPIQVGTIIYNERDRLPAWLEHWVPLVERVFLIDQDSDDGTHDILNESGIDWHIRRPHGNPDIHWNDLLSIVLNGTPMLRLGVDEFIDRADLERMLRIIEKHPKIAAWWVSRLNLIDGHDIAKHPEVSETGNLLLDDWQLVLSTMGKPYTFCGRLHSWPDIHVPAQMIGYMPRDLKIQHRRTLGDIENANNARRHMCRTKGGSEQDWFLRVAREVATGVYDE